MFDIKDQGFGVVYAVTGEKYRKEALDAVSSLKSVMPDIKTALAVDNPTEIPPDIFDYIHVIEKPRFSTFDKIETILNTPFVKTLYIDTDTMILAPFYELGDLLDRFDLLSKRQVLKHRAWYGEDQVRAKLRHSHCSSR